MDIMLHVASLTYNKETTAFSEENVLRRSAAAKSYVPHSWIICWICGFITRRSPRLTWLYVLSSSPAMQIQPPLDTHSGPVKGCTAVGGRLRWPEYTSPEGHGPHVKQKVWGWQVRLPVGKGHISRNLHNAIPETQDVDLWHHVSKKQWG